MNFEEKVLVQDFVNAYEENNHSKVKEIHGLVWDLMTRNNVGIRHQIHNGKSMSYYLDSLLQQSKNPRVIITYNDVPENVTIWDKLKYDGIIMCIYIWSKEQIEI